MKIENKHAVVTGASTGIGRAVAVALAKQGVTVGLLARSVDGLNKTLKLVEEVGGQGKIFPLDLRNTSDIYNLTKSLKDQWNRIDILVNVAGIYHDETHAYYDKPFEKYSMNEILNTYEVGFTGPTLLTHALLPLMPKGSHIINLSGTFENGAKGWLPYYASKRALEDFTVGLSQDLKDKGIFVNGISPSDTATESYKKFFPQFIDEAMDPTIIGDFVASLCSRHNPPTGKIFVLKKSKAPYEAFHE